MLKRIAVLISGGGSNLQAVIDACEQQTINAEIVGVISNKRKAYGLVRAKKHNIQALYIGKGNYESAHDRHTQLRDTLEALNVDLIVLAGYLEILQADFFKKFSGRVINVHPSLLPQYSGLGFYGMKVHEAVIKNKEKYSGATVHFVSEQVDRGQIIIQEAISVFEGETAQSLQKRVLKVEHKILVSSIKKIIEGDI